ncbi:hypothetical protein Slin14017_G122570 [Septoria linicola]|nr:hypothetical protein Slin14017_G122570 [Septoria linicola]
MRILERMDDLETQIAGVLSGVNGIRDAQVSSASSLGLPAQSNVAPGPHTIPPDYLFSQNLESVLQWNVLSGCHGSEFIKPNLNIVTPSERLSVVTLLDEDLEHSGCSTLLDAFFAHVHPKNPILDEQSIRGHLKTTCLHGFGWDVNSGFLLLLLALGATATSLVAAQNSAEPDVGRAQALYTLAQKRFGTITSSAYVEQAKCTFYSGVLLMSMLQPFEAWRMFLQALAACQGFRLLSTSRSEPSLARDQSEESLYWSCWKSEREVRSELGLPDFSTATLGHPQLYPDLPYGYEDLIDLSRNGDVDSNRLLNVVQQLEDPLERWQSSLPPLISINAAEEPSDDILRFVLRGRLTDNKELLTWAFLHTALQTSTDLPAVSLDFVSKGLTVHYDRLVTNQPGFEHRHHGRHSCLAVSSQHLSTEAEASTSTEIQSNDGSANLLGNSPYITWTSNPNKSDGSGLLLASGSPLEEGFVESESAIQKDGEDDDCVSQGTKPLPVGNGDNFGPKDSNSIACAVVPTPAIRSAVFTTELKGVARTR